MSGRLRRGMLRRRAQHDDYALTVNSLGTQGGTLYAINDSGRRWTTLAEGLPAMRSVKIAYAV